MSKNISPVTGDIPINGAFTTQRKVDLLDRGYVRLVDRMGDDLSVLRAARVSYDADWRTGEDAGKDEKLIHYLLKNRHCYHPSMEVLTSSGWVRWDKCPASVEFLVPDPATRTLKKEVLPVLSFPADEDMILYENTRVSFCVTADHRMRFLPQRGDGYRTVTAGQMGYWGHLDPLIDYCLYEYGEDLCPEHQFIGFYLGDGCYSSANQVTFHLKKPRKKEYLLTLLQRLNIEYREKQSLTYEDATVYTVIIPNFLRKALGSYLRARSAEKNVAFSISTLTAPQGRGLLDGLVNSDGSIKQDRPQIQFSSASPNLLNIFETLNAFVGIDAHRASTGCTAYHGERTSLEVRKDYFSKVRHTGKVYCATTDTGWLMVRGGPDKFGFVCGNTSPFESVCFTFEVKAPIFVFRQWHRHRTWSYNEMSARYTELPDEFYVPEPCQITTQSKSNKQSRTDEQHPHALRIAGDIAVTCEAAFAVYKKMMDQGCPRELARGVLPLNTYSRMFATVNLHNLFHFLKLRLHEHAQYEIRVYAEAMLQLIEEYVPVSVSAFRLHVLGKAVEEKRLLSRIAQLEDWKEYAMTEYFKETGENLDELPGVIEEVDV
jgi:thymidylate synthase (FAD)